MNFKWELDFKKPVTRLEDFDSSFTPLLTAVLYARNITTFESYNRQYICDFSSVHDAFGIMGMEKAIERIKTAIASNEKIAVYGDYDVDGITATCILTDYLKSISVDCISYIPNRKEEGYGVNRTAIDYLNSCGVTLIITVDCGITAIDEVNYASSLDIDTIITDHHECGSNSVPNSVAVLDCKQSDDTYPNKHLAGVGMSLKLVCALDGNSEKIISRYCDLFCIGTIADVMPLTPENRYIIKLGLNKLSQSPRPGLKALFHEASVDNAPITASTIGYIIAPRLNAAGRLGDAELATELILTDDDNIAAEKAVKLCQLNQQRQTKESVVWQMAQKELVHHQDDVPIILSSEDWDNGVVGIVASRLAEHYKVPTIIICLTDDNGKGSCRSYGGFNLFDALTNNADLLTGFGGHALAAGLSIRRSDIPLFREKFCEYYRKCDKTLQDITCNLVINDPELLSIASVKSLDILEPYGNQNPKPQLCLYGVYVEDATEVGGGKHMKLRVRLKGTSFDAIFFSHTLEDCGIHQGDYADIIFTPQINEFRGNVSVQLVINNIKRHTGEELCDKLLNSISKEATDDADIISELSWFLSSYCPEREDNVIVWKTFDKSAAPTSNVVEFLSRCPKRLRPETYAISICSFVQAGLMSKADTALAFQKIENTGRVSLEDTEIIKKLRSTYYERRP